MFKNKLGEFLKEKRIKNNLYQRHVAEHLGVSIVSVSQYESGSSSLCIEGLFKVSKLLKFDLNEIYLFTMSEK